LADTWQSLIDPEAEFDFMNIDIHGIDEGTILGAPALPDVHSKIFEWLSGRVVVCRTHFDRVALGRANMRYQLPAISCQWLDSARVARRAWEAVSTKGYGLRNVCDMLGYRFQQHHALEDAKAAGFVVLSAINGSGLDLETWIARLNQPI